MQRKKKTKITVNLNGRIEKNGIFNGHLKFTDKSQMELEILLTSINHVEAFQ